MVTGPQIRAARALLEWEAEKLAGKTGLSRDTIFNIEKGTVQARTASLEKIIRVFNDNGIEFLPDEGVKRKSDSITKLEGFNDFKFFMDLVYEAAQQPFSYDGSKPICICNLDNSLFRKHMGDYHAAHVERLSKLDGLVIRSLSAAIDANHVAKSSYLSYRYLSGFKSAVTPFYVFADKFSLIDFNVQNPPRILMVHSPSLAASYREQFEVLWESASVRPLFESIQNDKQ